MKNNKFFDFLTLFASAGTLTCCALPALLVALGAGGVMVSLVTNVPGLIWVSKNKTSLFLFAGAMLFIGGTMKLNARNISCPIDKNLDQACSSARKISNYTYVFSLFLYLVSVFFAFIAPKFL